MTSETPTPKAAEPNPSQTLWSRHQVLATDLCRLFLSESPDAQAALKSLKNKLSKPTSKNPFRLHERPWVLRIVFDELIKYNTTPSVSQSPDSRSVVPLKPQQRLEVFQQYVRQLTPHQRFVLLVIEKFSLPLDEVASAMRIPPDSVKQIWKQALASLEDWIWPKS